MKKLALLAAAAALSAGAQAQDVYGGVGVPGLVTLGYAQPMSDKWGVRGEFAGGLSVSQDGVQDGVNATGSIKSNRVGVFGDWFPFGSGFRVVGGVTFNDTKLSLKAVGTGTADINGKTVNMSNETFNVDIKYPSATPYIGIGYGHQLGAMKGLGFYYDIGVMIGSFKADVTTSLVGDAATVGTITQADIDAQKKKMQDSLSKLSVLPSASIGVVYRF